MRVPFNIFKNWDKVCYIRKRIETSDEDITLDDYGNEIPQYEEEVTKFLVNYQPVTNDAEEATLKPYGITSRGTVKLLLDYKYLGSMERYDLAYLYDATPEGEKYIGENANYRVVTAIPQNVKILVYFEKLVKN